MAGAQVWLDITVNVNVHSFAMYEPSLIHVGAQMCMQSLVPATISAQSGL